MDDPTKDLIPRSAVEYCCRKNTVSTNPDDYKAHEKFIQFMDDPEISEFGRWQHANGFNTALVAIECDLDKIPSVQPEHGNGYRDGYKRGKSKGFKKGREIGRKKGKWRFSGYQMFECTECGTFYTQSQFQQMRVVITDPEFPRFCPTCGADMREEGGE